MTRISILDNYFISSFVLTCAGITGGLGLVTWWSFAFEWVPWTILAMTIIAVIWFYNTDKARDESIIDPACHTDKTPERVEKP